MNMFPRADRYQQYPSRLFDVYLPLSLVKIPLFSL